MEHPVSGPKSVLGHRDVLIVAATAFALALAGAWMRPVWHDELYTLSLARLPMRELISALVVDSGPPLHYLLCHALFVLVGWQEGSVLGTLMLRLPSVLAFALLPWVVGRARSVTCRTLPWGPLLAVVWLPLLYFGTEARTYALLALVNAVVWIRGPAWVERGGRRIVLFAVFAACLPLLHYAGIASLVALPALAFFVAREHRTALATALSAAALPTLAWLPVMMGAPRASMGWVSTGAGAGRPGLATARVLSPAGPFPALFEVSVTAVPPWVSQAILVVLIAGALIGGRRLWKNRTGNDADLKRAARLGIGLLPAVGLGLAALAGLPLYFAGRTESMVWALAAAMVAILIVGLPPIARRIVGGAYVVVGAMTVALWLTDLPTHPPAPGVEVGRALASRITEGDRVVVAGLWQLEVQHGLAAGALIEPAVPNSVETVPRSQAEHPGWLDLDAVLSPSLAMDARELERRARVENSRIWMVWSPALPLERNFFPAFSGWRRESIAGSPIIAVDLLTPPAAASIRALEGIVR
jgi:mannosyltransferase